MPDSRDAPTSYALIDLAAVVISPALVMIMVGSFVYFAIDTIYAGAYPGRLHWCLGFFVFGAVLIARLSIETSRKYAALYAAGLGGACFLAMMQYVTYPSGILSALGPVLNILLMALIWLMADKLTWDCTHLDEDQKASGRGILAATGLDDAAPQEEEESDEPPADGKKKRKLRKWEEEGYIGWVERFKAYRKDQKKKPHTPGTWVLYIGLGALPFFALGQSLIPADDGARRTAIFIDMALYVGSALGLLVTTTLFGLRKYLVQRNARVPPVLAMSWLGLGAGLIVLFLAVGAILPRPHSETPLVDLGGRKKGDRSASRYAVIRDSDAGKGKGAAGQKGGKGEGKASGKGGEPGGKSGEKGGGGGKGDSSGGKQSKGDSKGSGDKSGKQGDQSQGKQSQGKESQNKGDQKDSQSKGDQDQKGDDNKSDNGDQEQDAQSDDSNADSTDSSSSSFSKLSQVLDGLSNVVKWIVWIALAIAVIVGIVVFFLKYLAPFTKWAKGLLDWLRGLFGPKFGGAAAESAAAVEAKIERPPPSFVEFTNPFADGSAGSRDVAELAQYSFAALDAWAWDRDQGRKPEETPMEFATRVGHEYPPLDEPGYKAAELLVRVMYSRKPLPADARKTLAELWDQMDATQARR